MSRNIVGDMYIRFKKATQLCLTPAEETMNHTMLSCLMWIIKSLWSSTQSPIPLL